MWFVKNKMSVHIVSSINIDKAFRENHESYAQYHGYKYWANSSWSRDMKDFFRNLKSSSWFGLQIHSILDEKINSALNWFNSSSTAQHDWMVWIDPDCMFTDITISLDYYLNMFRSDLNVEKIIFTTSMQSHIFSKPTPQISTTMFFLCKSQQCEYFLKWIYRKLHGYRMATNFDDEYLHDIIFSEYPDITSLSRLSIRDKNGVGINVDSQSYQPGDFMTEIVKPNIIKDTIIIAKNPKRWEIFSLIARGKYKHNECDKENNQEYDHHKTCEMLVKEKVHFLNSLSLLQFRRKSKSPLQLQIAPRKMKHEQAISIYKHDENQANFESTDDDDDDYDDNNLHKYSASSVTSSLKLIAESPGNLINYLVRPTDIDGGDFPIKFEENHAVEQLTSTPKLTNTDILYKIPEEVIKKLDFQKLSDMFEQSTMPPSDIHELKMTEVISGKSKFNLFPLLGFIPELPSPEFQSEIQETDAADQGEFSHLRLEGPRHKSDVSQFQQTKTPKTQRGIPTPKVQRGIPTPKVQREIPTPKVQRGIPAPKVQREIPTPEAQQGIPTPEAQQGIPTPEAQQGIPTPEAQQEPKILPQNKESPTDDNFQVLMYVIGGTAGIVLLKILHSLNVHGAFGRLKYWFLLRKKMMNHHLFQRRLDRMQQIEKGLLRGDQKAKSFFLRITNPSQKRSSARLKSSPSQKRSSARLKSSPSQKRSSAQLKSSPSQKRSSARLKSSPSQKRSSARLKSSPSQKRSSARSNSSPSQKRSSARLNSSPSQKRSSARLNSSPSQKRSSARLNISPSQKRSSAQLNISP